MVSSFNLKNLDILNIKTEFIPYLEDANMPPLTAPKVEQATNTGIIHFIPPNNLFPKVWTWDEFNKLNFGPKLTWNLVFELLFRLNHFNCSTEVVQQSLRSLTTYHSQSNPKAYKINYDKKNNYNIQDCPKSLYFRDDCMELMWTFFSRLRLKL